MSDLQDREKRICMIVPQPDVKGGIAGVVSHYYGSRLEQGRQIIYVESYCDGSKWKKLKKALLAYVRFAKVLRKTPPDLVHIHSSFGPSFYRKLPFILMSHHRGIPVVNHVHGSAFDEFYAQAPGWKKRLVRRVYGMCSRVIVLTEQWKEKISQFYAPERIEVVQNFADVFAQMPDRYRQRLANPQVLFLGVITEGKGLHEMPAVIRQVISARPEVSFVIAGEGDDQYLRSHLSEEENKHVHLPGWVRGEEKDKLLRESAVFFLPSHMEAMPMSALEAMGYGLPVVSTDVGGIPFVVRQGENGWLLPAGDVQGMADAIIDCLADPERYRQASARSIAIVEENFSVEKHLQRLEQIWNEVLCHE